MSRIHPLTIYIISYILLNFSAVLPLAAESAATVPVTLLIPEIGSVEWVEHTTGELVAPQRATLQFKTSGFVDRVLVREGDRVRRAQPLAILDLEDANIALDQAKTAVTSAESQVAAASAALETARVGKMQALIRLETATRDYDRAKSLREKDTIPQQQFDQIEGQFKLAQNGVEVADRQIMQAEASLSAARSLVATANVGIRAARRRLNNSTLLAPFDGLVMAKSLMDHEPSDRQSLTLVDDSELELRIRLPERVLPFLTLGARVIIRSPLASEPVITSVNTIIPAIDRKTLTFEAIAVIPNTGHTLSHGGYADVDTVVRENLGTRIVPAGIVKITSDGTGATQGAARSGYVFTIRDGKAHKTPVTVGFSRGNRISILSGLATDTPIVDSGFDQLNEGTPVTVENETAR
ncbi:MAG TPA: efflux RND transporter periplasmic adaptor subunit [Candidatus Ozemobacteraceae bacterium]